MRRAFGLAIQISDRRRPQWRRASLFDRRCVSGLLVRGRAESGNFMALSATGATSRFLDASGEGAALPGYFK